MSESEEGKKKTETHIPLLSQTQKSVNLNTPNSNIHSRFSSLHSHVLKKNPIPKKKLEKKTNTHCRISPSFCVLECAFQPAWLALTGTPSKNRLQLLSDRGELV